MCFEKFFPHVCNLVLKQDLHNAILHNAKHSFPQKRVVQGIPVKKGVKICMPNYPAHYDAEFFLEPEMFKPERFLKENADQIIPYTWRPFGSGNRVCIGQRFALMEMKIFISKLLYKFKVERTPRTELKYSPGGFFIISYPEIRVALHPRN